MPVPFGQVRSIEGLAANLSCAVDDLAEFSDTPDQRRFYTLLRIPKKGKRRGQFRTVYKPIQRLSLIQKNLANWITTFTEFGPHVQGFVHRRSISTNARLHLGQRFILHADIQDFFDSIKIEQVEDAFRVLGCVESVARTLARISTLNGQLPQGSSVSPCLANLVARHVDADLQVLAQGSACRYSRYADDITISGDALPPESDVDAILRKHSFILRDGQCRVQRRGRTQYVTGLTVSDPTKPRVPTVQKRRLRLELYYAARFGIADHLERTNSELVVPEALARLHGWINFIYSVEGSGRLFQSWLKVQERFERDPTA